MCDCQKSSNNKHYTPSIFNSASLDSATDGHRIMGNNNMRSIRKMDLNSSTDGHVIWNSKGARYDNLPYSNSEMKSGGGYSCNPTIDAYVIATKDYNQNISRADLAKLPEDFIRPVFRGLSSFNKVRIFIEKFNLIASTENLTAEELTHLKSAFAFLKPELYDYEQGEAVNSFFENWMKFAQEKFGWNKDRIIGYVGSIYSPKKFVIQQSYYNNSSARGVGGGGGIDCNCASGKVQDFCSNSKCWSGGCPPSNLGCGWFWLSPCNGLCVWSSSTAGTF